MKSRESSLACHDILATIFDHLLPAYSDGHEDTEESRLSCRKALASSARACRSLSNHALNVLWRELDTIHPLLWTLPNCKYVDYELTLCGAISDENWTRFKFYANRVHAIVGSLEPYRMDLIHPSIWLFLAGRCKGAPLMPRLRELIITNLHISETPAVVLLMSPLLHTLQLLFVMDVQDEDQLNAPYVVDSLLQTVPLMAPNLENFCCNVDISLNHGYIKEFGQLTRLKQMSVSSKIALDESALRMLPSITTLRDIECDIDLSESFGLTLRPFTFEHLTSLRLKGSFDDLTLFMNACKLPSLTCASLLITQLPNTGEPANSFTAIWQRYNPRLLTSFTVDIHYKFTTDSPPPKRLMEYFEPLLTFPNIERFRLCQLSGVVPQIHDDDLTQFGAAWPRLSHFDVLHFGTKLPGATRPTLCALIDLARRCPHLDLLRVPEVDACVVTKNVILPAGHTLRTLSFDKVILPSPESPKHLASIAKVLDRVFPSMELRDVPPVGKENLKTWDKLKGLLKNMRLARNS